MNYPPYPISRFFRRTLMVLLIGAFFVLCPLLILYTAGYSYNFRTHEFRTTGVLSIDAIPRTAKVFVKNIALQKELPIWLPNLAPGTYSVKIEYPGYLTWQKDIDVKSNQTSYIKDIRLFQETATELLLKKEPTSQIYSSYRGEYMAILEQNEEQTDVFVLDTKTKEKKKILHIEPSLAFSFDWSPEANIFMVSRVESGNTLVTLIDAKNNTSHTHTLPGTDITSHWENTSPALYVQTSNGDVTRLEKESKKTLVTFTDSKAWYARDSSLWRLQNEGKEIEKWSNTKLDETFYLPIQLTQIVDINENRIIGWRDNTLVVLRFIDNQWKPDAEFEGARIGFNAATHEWNVWTPWELSTVYPDGRSVLLNRTSEAMESVQPLDDTGVLLITTKAKLLAFNPGYYVTHTLFEAESIEQAFVDQKERVIYFLGKVNGEEGLYQKKF